MADFMSSELDVKCMHWVHNTAKRGIQKPGNDSCIYIWKQDRNMKGYTYFSIIWMKWFWLKLSQFLGPERACKNGLSRNVYPPYIIRDSGMSSWPIAVIYIVFWPSATWWKTVFCVAVSYNL